MKKMFMLGLVCALLGLTMTGCTMPTQKIAAQSLEQGANHAHTVFYDMSRIARQSILDQGAASAVKAVQDQSTDGAQQAVKRVFDDMNKVDYLHVQWERARALIRVGQQYVWEQEGIVNVMIDEFEQAKKEVDAKPTE